MRAKRETAEQTGLLHLCTHLLPQQGNPWPIPSQPANTPAKMKERESRERGVRHESVQERPAGSRRGGSRLCNPTRPRGALFTLPRVVTLAPLGVTVPLGDPHALPRAARGKLRPRAGGAPGGPGPAPALAGRERGSAATPGQVRGEPRGAEARVPVDCGRGRGGGALTTGRTRE